MARRTGPAIAQSGWWQGPSDGRALLDEADGVVLDESVGVVEDVADSPLPAIFHVFG